MISNLTKQSLSWTENVLCFLLLLHHLILLHLLFFKERWRVAVSCTDVQHLQVGQVCEGAFVHRVHGEAVEPLKGKRQTHKQGFLLTLDESS